MKRTGMAVVCAMLFLLTGCGNTFPELTQEEAEVIGEYAAVTLLKYDADSRSRLVDLTDKETTAETIAEEEKTVESEVTEEKKEDSSGGVLPKEPEQTLEEGDETVLAVRSMEEYWALPEKVMVSYVGYEINSSYPRETKEYFALEASEGKSFLIVRFALENGSDTEQKIDFLNRKDSYRLTVNEQYTQAALTTLLENDLGTYLDTIKPGENKELVLLIELETADVENVQSILLNIKNESKKCTIQLL